MDFKDQLSRSDSRHPQSGSRMMVTRGFGVVPRLARFGAVLVVASMASKAHAADSAPKYATDIQPIFKAKCYSCHGPDKSESGLRLDRKADALAGGDSGKVIVPGDIDGSVMIKLVTGGDPDRLMPPDGEKLTDEQIKSLKEWIKAGAEWPDDTLADADPRLKHWAFQPVRRPVPPRSGPEISSPIDAFIFTKLYQEHVEPSVEADSATLIRRLSLDLLGLPPTPEAVDRFASDPSPVAYENLVDQILASPEFGERWGRHWLDLARYADSDGYEKDNPRYHAWKYRDWVIGAINEDMAFDQFTTEQLAGDLIENATQSQKVATGFNRQTLTNTEGGVDQEQFRNEAVFDRTETLGTVWLGLTVGCARCHTHKYDPLPQREYYQLFAFFNTADEASLAIPTSAEAWSRYETQLAAFKTDLERRQFDLKAAREPLREEYDKWEAETKEKLAAFGGPPASFQRLEMKSVVSENGATLTKQKNGSYLASGNRPQTDVYVLEVELPAGTSGLKLEALSNKALPASGPGWADHGNFVLSELTVDRVPSGDDDKGYRLEFATARASFSQDTFPPTKAIDGIEDISGWAIAPQFGKSHEAVFVFDEFSTSGLENGSTPVRIRLSQQYKNSEFSPHLLGCFRVTAMVGRDVSSLGLPDDVAAALFKEKSQRTAAESDRLFTHFTDGNAEIANLRQSLAEFEKSPPFKPEMPAAVMTAKTERVTHLLRRGDFLQPGDEIASGGLGILPELPQRDSSKPADRLDLARWLTSSDNPLTARVAVNHIWQHLFGRGIVKTTNDFGTRGDPPSHPELLDWLASEYIRLGWSRKRLIREIVLSATYRQSSADRSDLRERDPENVWLARQNRMRVEAEVVRDEALAVSGLLDDRIGGPSVFPPLPPGIEELSYADNFKWGASEWNTRPDRPWSITPKNDVHRRGMYTFFKRTAPHPNLTTFDCPDANLTCVERRTSNTPLQALVTLNNDTFIDAARALAQRVLRESHPDDQSRVRRMLRLCVGREPVSDDVRDFTAFLTATREAYRSSPDLARQFNSQSEAPPEAAAWIATARLMLNLDEFLTRE